LFSSKNIQTSLKQDAFKQEEKCEDFIFSVVFIFLTLLAVLSCCHKMLHFYFKI